MRSAVLVAVSLAGSLAIPLAASLAISVGAARPATAQSVSYSFEWQGGGGYEMRGALSIPAELATLDRVFETDVSCFEITGYKDAIPIGRWALGMLTPETTWTLTFNPSEPEFVVYSPGADMPQAWNMNGAGFNCGDPGFGFNIGNAAQDLCVDGALVVESQVPPPQPLPAQPVASVAFSQDACRRALLMGALQ